MRSNTYGLTIPTGTLTSSSTLRTSPSIAIASADFCFCQRVLTRVMVICPTPINAGTTLKQNLLAQSLHEDAYERDPGFTEFAKESGLPFKPHPEFRKADLDARQDLYRHLGEQIWNPDRLAKEAES